MKLIAGGVRITGFVMSVLLCSVGFGFASGEMISDTASQSIAWDADITVPTTTKEVTIAVASETPIQASFGGNGATNLNTQTQTDTQLTLIAEPAYTCGQGFAGRVSSNNINDAGVLIRLSDLNGRTVINFHPHVDSDGDYRQGVNYQRESSMFYVASGYYQVLIVAYNGNSTESIVFDTYIGTDCPSDNQENNGSNTDPQQPWDYNLGGYHFTDTIDNPGINNTNNSSSNKPKPNTNINNQSTIAQATINNSSNSENNTTIEADITNNNLASGTSTSGDTNNNSLDSGITDHTKNKNKDDRYKWLIGAILGGGLIYYGVKMNNK